MLLRGQGVSRSTKECSSAALAGALRQIAAAGGGNVESYPEDVEGREVSASFLYNSRLAMFEQQGFARMRRLGKHHWVDVQGPVALARRRGERLTPRSRADCPRQAAWAASSPLFMMPLAAQAACRGQPLSSNVRPRETSRLLAWGLRYARCLAFRWPLQLLYVRGTYCGAPKSV